MKAYVVIACRRQETASSIDHFDTAVLAVLSDKSKADDLVKELDAKLGDAGYSDMEEYDVDAMPNINEVWEHFNAY